MVQLRITEGIRLAAERASTSKSVSPIAAEAAKDIAAGALALTKKREREEG
jgi:hypothetical protein